MHARSAFARFVVTPVLGRYENYWIFAIDAIDSGSGDVPHGYRVGEARIADLERSPHAEIRERARYGGPGAVGFAAFHRDEVVCVLWYWYGDRYAERGFWPLERNEAKSVDTFTLPGHRGRGLAATLKSRSVGEMKRRGFERLYSRVWHSNSASVAMNRRAGWTRIARVFTARLFGLLPVRIERRYDRAGASRVFFGSRAQRR